VTEELGIKLESLTLADLGQAKKVTIDKDHTTIIEPMRWIATNAGHEGSIVVRRVKEMDGDEGFNAQTERYENLVQAGVIDPTKVVRLALQHAASVASLLLTTEAVISPIPERPSL
jgi:chaperonin GroEL